MDNGAASYRRFIDGDQEAFGEIVDLYRENLIFFIHRYVNDLDTAEDLAEDAFVELIVHPERFEGKSSLKTFLFAIARNKAVDWLRKHKRMKPVPLDEVGEIADLRTLEQAVAAEDRKRRLSEALEQIKDEYRIAIHLVYLEEMSRFEIGQAKAEPYWFALCLTDVFYNSSIILLIVSNIPGSLFLTTSKTIVSSMSK